MTWSCLKCFLLSDSQLFQSKIPKIAPQSMKLLLIHKLAPHPGNHSSNPWTCVSSTKSFCQSTNLLLIHEITPPIHDLFYLVIVRKCSHQILHILHNNLMDMVPKMLCSHPDKTLFWAKQKLPTTKRHHTQQWNVPIQ